MKIKLLLLCFVFATSGMRAWGAPPQITVEEAKQIAAEAYVYLYPIISMDISRKQMTNMQPGILAGHGPENMFQHMREYPSANFKAVVRPNFDTLYSSAWLNIKKEPVLITMPDTKGRYYLLPILDMWTDVIASPGWRTSGTGKQVIAVTPPGWQGNLPDGVIKVQSTTPYVWVIGRIKTNGISDYPAVNAIQDQMSIVPLSRWGQTSIAKTTTKIDPNIDMKTKPVTQVNSMPANKYFTYGSSLLKENAVHATDWSQIERFKRIGLYADGKFDFAKLSPEIQKALIAGAAMGLENMRAKIPTVAKVVNGWSMNTDTMGVYGNAYLKRAIVAMIGLGANQPEDAVYPLALTDREGQPLKGENRYTLHFSAKQLPPTSAFWSLTMYDQEGFQVSNELNRFAIGDRDNLKFNKDGSLDIYIQHKNPGPERAANWLPSPATGELGVTMRIYGPKAEVLDGRWEPPAIMKNKSTEGKALR